MLSSRLDTRVCILTFIFNRKEMLTSNILDEFLLGNIKSEKEALEKVFNILNLKGHVNNIDEVYLLLKKYYSKDKQLLCNQKIKELYFIDRIYELARIFLSTRNGNFILKYWGSESGELLGAYNNINKIAMWNSFSRELNIDNLVYQYLVHLDMNDDRYLKKYKSIVHIEDLQLENVLSKGVAETHLHINAGISFEVKWHNLMNSDVEKLNFKGTNIISYGTLSEEVVKRYVKVAAILRIILAYYLEKGMNLCDMIGFYEKIDKNLLDNILSINKFPDENQNFDDILDKIKNMFFRDIININECDSWEVKLNKEDFLSQVFSNYEEGYLLESFFVFNSFKALYKKNKNNLREDILFVKLFYKYILIKDILYSLFNQDNNVKGLDKFVDSYEDATQFNGAKGQRLALALRCQLQAENIVKLEIRQSIPHDKKGNKSKIKKALRKNLIDFFRFYKILIEERMSAKKGTIPALGIVYHLIKGKDDFEKCWFNYESGESKYIYFQNYRKLYKSQIEAMKELRENIPYLSNYIVGIDAASIEHNTDPWVFAPIFECARNGEQKILCIHEEKEEKISNLGFTFHVGEEFRHLLSGLRNIYEVIKYLKFRAGDRIGHGIALGINCEKWACENSVVVLPRIEYLEDLIWLWDMLTNSDKNVEYDINHIERKIINLAHEIYGANRIITVNMLHEAYKQKFEEYIRDDDFYNKVKVNCKSECYNNEQFFICSRIDNQNYYSWDAKKISEAYNCKLYLKKMYEPIEIKINKGEIVIMNELQSMVRDLIADKGIVVETNPTSNRIIGQVDNIFEHYISNLNGINNKKNILVSINTDDPCVFNTNINNEYAYIFYSLLNKGYDRTVALKWINKIREIGIESSFIKERNVSIERIKHEVEYILNTLQEIS